MSQIPLRNRQGKVVAHAVIDDQDAEFLNRWRWSLNGSGYAFGSPGLMHRVVLGLEKGDGREVDHCNRDKLDNRVANLRLTTRAANIRNSDRADASALLTERVRSLRAEGLRRIEIAELLDISYAQVTVRLRGTPRVPADSRLVWTKERLIAVARDFAEKNGRPPKQGEFNGQEGRPWYPAVYRQFSGWPAFLEAAGFGSAIDFRRLRSAA